MLYEIFKGVLLVCGSIIALLLTGVTAKLAWSVFKSNKHFVDNKLFATYTASTDGNPAHNNLCRIGTEISLPESKAIVPMPSVKPAKSGKAPESFTLMCGKCSKKITSAPTGTAVIDGHAKVHYRCEHCGSEVAVES